MQCCGFFFFLNCKLTLKGPTGIAAGIDLVQRLISFSTYLTQAI